MAAWASIAETLAYTRINVEQEDIDSAQAMIELFADVIYDQSAKMSTKNLRLLKMAVAYQAAWMIDHPDVFTHVDIGSINQDGIFFVQAHENAMLIAPMARRALSRLSWNRTRNIKIRPSTNRLVSKRFIETAFDAGTEFIVDSFPNNTPEQDDNLPWSQV